MPVEVILPKVDMDMEAGTLSAWHVAEGEEVRQGAPLFDIETDKAAMEVEAPATGRVHHVMAKPGDRLPVGALIAWIYPEGETVGAPPAASPPAAGESPVLPAEAAPAAAAAAPAAAPAAEKPRATPVARRLAAEAGLTLAAIPGTGPRGRIQRADVEAAQARASAAPEVQPAPAATPAVIPATPPPAAVSAKAVMKLYEGREFTEEPLDGMRRIIAERLSEAKRTIPHFYLRREVRLDALLQFRSSLNKSLEARSVKLSVTDFIIKASALALQEVPEANAVWAGDRVLKLRPSDIAVAVAVEGGLFTPVLRDADRKTVSALSIELKDLAARARARKLAPGEYQGGSFAISNLGMFGVESFDAVINPPQAAILAVGAGLKKPIIEPDGSHGTATLMALTLSVDHRVIDGALGAKLLAAIVALLEDPAAMLA